MLRFEHVSLSYGSQKILDDLSFEIQEGQMAVLIGPSGCGKTTTLKMINRLIEPSAGKIYLNEEDITAKDKVELRRHIGYVIQQIGLFPNMTVAQNICVVPTLLKYSKEECDKIVHSLLRSARLSYEQYAHKYPSEMSGGQQQRIGILRALAASPPIVLMDEPFSALDPMTRRSLQQEVRSLQQKLNKTFVFVTHDMEEALDLADVIIFMDHGKIVQMAPPEEMLAHPASGQIQDFLGKFIDTPCSEGAHRRRLHAPRRVHGLGHPRGQRVCQQDAAAQRGHPHRGGRPGPVPGDGVYRGHPPHRPCGQDHRAPHPLQHSHRPHGGQRQGLL